MAFMKAVAQEKKPFKLKGRGFEPRVTFNPKLEGVLRDVDLPSVNLDGFGSKFKYPRRVAVRASRMLKRKFGFEVVVLYRECLHL